MSLSAEQIAKDFASVKSIINKLGETFNGLQVHSKSILSLAEQWQTSYAEFSAIDDMVVTQVTELEVKKKQISAHASRIRNIYDKFKARKSKLDLREKCLNERMISLEVEKKDVEQCRKAVEWMEAKSKEDLNRINALDEIEKEVGKSWEKLELEKVRVDELSKELERKEGEIASRCKEMELEKVRIDGLSVELERKKMDIEKRCEEMELDKVRVDELIAELRKEKDVSEYRLGLALDRINALDVREKEFDRRCEELEFEKVRVDGLSAKLGKGETKEMANYLVPKKEDLEEWIREVESKEIEVNARISMVEMKEEQMRVKEMEMDEVYEALESREKEMIEAERLLKNREKLINDSMIAVQTKEEKLKKQSEALELKEKNVNELSKVLELKEKDLIEFCKVLEAKENDMDDRHKVLEAEEREISTPSLKVEEEEEAEELNAASERVRLEEKRLNDLSKAHELKDKGVNVGERPFELKEKQVNSGFQVMELKEKKVGESYKAMEVKEGEVDERCKAADVKAKHLNERVKALELKENEILKRCRAMEGLELKGNRIELKASVVDEHIESGEVSLKQMDGHVKALRFEQDIPDTCSLKQSERESRPSDFHDVVCSTSDSASLEVCPDIHMLCKKMDSHGVRSYLIRCVKENNLLWNNLFEALTSASNPTKLVLDISRTFFEPVQDEVDSNVVKVGCLYLLEHLIKLSPSITPDVEREAKDFAVVWKERLNLDTKVPINFYGFLHFVAAYKLAKYYTGIQLMTFFKVSYFAAKTYPLEKNADLCRALGIYDKMPVFVRALINEQKLLAAVKCISLLKMERDFPPVPLLEAFLELVKQGVDNKLKTWNSQQKVNVVAFELAHLRKALNSITNLDLPFTFSTDSLLSRIKQLEEEKKDKRKHDGTSAEMSQKRSRIKSDLASSP